MLDIALPFNLIHYRKNKNVVTSIIKNMLYRISFLTEMLVDADNYFEAERIAYNNLADEVKKRISEIQEICLLSSIEQLKKNEQEILPWRSPSENQEANASQLTVKEILLAGDKKRKRKTIKIND